MFNLKPSCDINRELFPLVWPTLALTLVHSQVFSVDTTPEEFKNATITELFGFVFKDNSGGNSHNCEVIVFKNLRFENLFCTHENKEGAFPNSSGLKSVFEKLRFRDGLVWTEGLTVQIKLRF